MRAKWNDLSPLSRRLLIATAILDGSMKIAALVDLRRRPASDVRGNKAAWATAIAFVNSGGALPLAYFFRGIATHRQSSMSLMRNS